MQVDDLGWNISRSIVAEVSKLNSEVWTEARFIVNNIALNN